MAGRGRQAGPTGRRPRHHRDVAGRPRAVRRRRCVERAGVDLTGLEIVDRLRQRRHHGHRAGGAGAAGRDAAARSASSRTASTSTTAAGPPTSPCCRRRCSRPAPTWASPSTGTAIACWRSDADGEPVDGDQILAICAVAKRSPRRAGRRRGGDDDDDEPRVPPRDGGRGHRGAVDRRRRPLRDGGDARQRLRAGRRAERPPHRPLATARPATASPPACTCCARCASARRDARAGGRGDRPAPPAAARQRAGRAQAGPGRTPPAVWEAVRRAEAELGEDGRVVVRSSGTEPLVRVMVEAPTAENCDRWCREIAEVARSENWAGD